MSQATVLPLSFQLSHSVFTTSLGGNWYYYTHLTNFKKMFFKKNKKHEAYLNQKQITNDKIGYWGGDCISPTESMRISHC